MKEVGIGLYKPEMPTGENAPASLHNIGASPMWHVMTLRRRGGNEAFRNNFHRCASLIHSCTLITQSHISRKSYLVNRIP